MSKNEHAFPHMHFDGTVISLKGGLTKRELFAAMAMQGILSNPAWDPKVHSDEERVARTARINADALLKELSKGGGE